MVYLAYPNFSCFMPAFFFIIVTCILPAFKENKYPHNTRILENSVAAAGGNTVKETVNLGIEEKKRFVLQVVEAMAEQENMSEKHRAELAELEDKWKGQVVTRLVVARGIVLI